MSGTLGPRSPLHRVLGLMAVIDLVVGLVLAGAGMANDNETLALVGTLLVLSGGGMLAFVIWQRNKPTAL